MDLNLSVCNGSNTVKPRPEAHIDMILFEVFLKGIDLIPQQQILQRHWAFPWGVRHPPKFSNGSISKFILF